MGALATLDYAVREVEAGASELGAVAESLRMLDETLEMMPLPMVVSNGQHWRFVSGQFSRLLGWGRTELNNVPWETIIHPDDLDATNTEVARVLSTRDMGQIVNRYRVKGTQSYRRLKWRWGAPGQSGYTVAIAEDLGPA